MFPNALSIVLVLVTLACGVMGYRTWRSPNNWHLDGDSGQVEFHRWLDLWIYLAIGTLALITAVLGAFL